MAASQTFVFVRSADEDSGGVSARSSSTSSPGGARRAEGTLRYVPAERRQLTERLLDALGRADMSGCPQWWGGGRRLGKHEVSVFPLRIRGALIPDRCQVSSTLEMTHISPVSFSTLDTGVCGEKQPDQVL